MKFEPRVVVNYAWYIVCLIAVVGGALLEAGPMPFLSAHAMEVIAAVVVVATWIKNHKDIFRNPDGTDSRTPYEPGKKS